jgi:hypothetical protein
VDPPARWQEDSRNGQRTGFVDEKEDRIAMVEILAT